VRGLEAHEVCAFVRLSGGEHVAENFTTLVPWKWVTLAKPDVQAVLRERAGSLQLATRVNVVTPFFHAAIDGEEGRFQGDWRVLRPGRTYVMPWIAHGTAGRSTLPRFRKQLRTLSLYDLYAH